MTNRSALALAALALPLLAFDCGGPTPDPSPTGCAVRLTGLGLDETLVCSPSAFDYHDLDPTSTEWAFEFGGLTLDNRVHVSAGFFLPARPALGVPYGWSASGMNVESGDASRETIDPFIPAAPVTTHEASAPFFSTDVAIGAFTVTFRAIPPPGAQGPALAAVHGSLVATLMPVGVGLPVTMRSDF